MIIGDISLDPRKIISGQIIRKHGKWYLSIMYEVGDSACQFNVKCADFDSASLWILKLDRYAHKDSLLDAISDKSLEEIEADLDAECKIGFTC
jgi:hypothetical protein